MALPRTAGGDSKGDYNASVASISVAVNAVKGGKLRPLNVLRDLPQVADLIELCFRSTMDDEGHSYLQQMRRASNDRDFLSWAGRLMDSASMPLAGYVWEENGRIVGNVSLVFQTYRGRRIAMIANVATDPGFRRAGIGRALTQRAMEAARQKGTVEIWLQVRDDNPTAIRLYSELGFVERARRTTYRSKPFYSSPSVVGPAASGTPGTSSHTGPRGVAGISVLRRTEARHWPARQAWLERAHPEELSWYAHWNWRSLGPGLGNYLSRLFMDSPMRQWSAVQQDQLKAAVAWMPSTRAPNSLWIAAPQDADGAALRLALEAARRDLAHQSRLAIEHPAGEASRAILESGFEATRTLLWMRASATGAPADRIQSQKET
jgi:ribosomal protein S18 acetylase RimI-like enzyme